MISKERIRNIWKHLLDGPKAKRVQKYIRWTVVTAIVGIILYQLYDIGWKEVLQNLPGHPLFYILFFVLYLSLPVAEVLIYRRVWPIPRWKLFKIFLSKRVYNEEVMGYSGEFYLFVRIRNWLDIGDREILKSVRDNNILSAVNSNLVALCLIGVLVFTGVIDLDQLIERVDLVYILLGIFIASATLFVLVQFRSYIFSLSLRKAVAIYCIYLVRFLIHHGLMIVQWAVVLPDTPISVWFLFLTIVIIVNRIPLLPSRDLVFMWAGIELSRMLNMATASVAGMLLVSSALRKLTNLILFMILSTYSKDPDVKPVQKPENSGAIQSADRKPSGMSEPEILNKEGTDE
ncbi:MAG: hypothetical protein WDZ33_01385 [Balneolaceae bacterium]